ncbi:MULTISPECIES: DUF559 domain-containing protein [unclassified Blastococcus]|uniref:DUF559 domain-containing protein n=1 Tax=unclassified Blastococcus TaxID=2619396 RepID=UPI001EEF9132|nr:MULTISPECIES: DUF559 domain-containing protein [unclassified Blastococcus]
MRPGRAPGTGAAVRGRRGQRVVVEYEGAYHFDDLQIARDDERYRRLAAAGWRVVRLAAHDLRDMDAVVARIRAALLG